MLWQSFRRGSVEQRLLAVACAAALTGFAVHNLADAANIWKAALVGDGGGVGDRRQEPPLAGLGGSERGGGPPRAGRLRSVLPRGLLVVAFVALPLVWLRSTWHTATTPTASASLGWGNVEPAHHRRSRRST